MARRGAHHSRVGIIRPKRTMFDLSYEKKFTCNFGELIPVMCDEVVPGDHFTIGCQDVIRFQPMVAPLLHEVTVTLHYFFVPYRIIEDGKQWEYFISGGPDGKYNNPLPRMDETEYTKTLSLPNPPEGTSTNFSTRKFTFWDYMGWPISTYSGGTWAPPTGTDCLSPMVYPLRAYNLIWEEFYRDENFQPKVGLIDVNDTNEYPAYRLSSVADTQPPDGITYHTSGIRLRNWVKDYFTSALPWQQRGDPVAFPISGILPVEWAHGEIVDADGNEGGAISWANSSQYNGNLQVRADGTGTMASTPSGGGQYPMVTSSATVDMTEVTSFDVTQLRLAVQLQKWMERNARGGIRYTELLKTHFGVSPSDSRLQRPEYIGGSNSPVVISEVLQTSATLGSSPSGDAQTPQATMAGHGIVAASGYIGKYFVKEYGLIMGLLSVRPTPSYEQGIDRQWLRYTNKDFYWPEFVNLSEQGIFTQELFATSDQGTDPDNPILSSPGAEIWGYQPQYDEMRIKRNMVCSEFRVASNNNISYWHMGRAWTTAPQLNAEFLKVDPSDNWASRPFAVGGIKPLMISHANRIKAIRPLPYIGEPGLVDHH